MALEEPPSQPYAYCSEMKAQEHKELQRSSEACAATLGHRDTTARVGRTRFERDPLRLIEHQ